jgi:threonine dehydratase
VAIDHTPSFVDGMGGRSVLEEMWPLASQVLAGAIIVSLQEVAAAIKLLVERARVVAEGAGAASVAAVLTGKAGDGRVVCVVSGGNIDVARLQVILAGGVP